MTALQTLIRSRINGKASPTGWISFNCPVCVVNGQPRPDIRQRGGLIFNPDGAVSYHCFNCNFKTAWTPGRLLSFRMRKFLRQLGCDEAEIQRLNLELLAQADVENLVFKEPEPAWVPDWKDFEFDFDVSPLADPNKIEYLKSRQIYDLAVWLETTNTHMHLDKRVILPFTDHDRLIGFTSRYVGECPPKVPKYYKKSQPGYVYGLDNQRDSRQYVIVTEGEFDALLTGGVAVGTNSINEHQVQLIEDLNIEPIVIPDKDHAGRQLAEQAADYRWNVSFPEWEGCKDVTDAVLKYGRLFTIYSIIQAAEHSPTKIKLLSRKLGN